MIDNPMATDYIKTNIVKYPGTLQAVFSAINRYAYSASAAIEGPLGEGYRCVGKPTFDYAKLVSETTRCIRENSRSVTNWDGVQLRRALANAALTDSDLDNILKITEEEALARIDQATSKDQKVFTEHGHHGRQYIARNTVERVMKEVLPLKP